jgi:peptidoglycan hydrolase-like protein with peptidoglycan-binding domain
MVELMKLSSLKIILKKHMKHNLYKVAVVAGAFALLFGATFVAADNTSTSTTVGASSAYSVDQLQAMIKSLQTQVATLQAQLAQRTPGAASNIPSQPVNINRSNVHFGASNDDVMTLQKFLTSKGYLPATSDTGLFGESTKFALQAFQEDHGLSSSDAGFGNYGPTTNNIVNQESQLPGQVITYGAVGYAGQVQSQGQMCEKAGGTWSGNTCTMPNGYQYNSAMNIVMTPDQMQAACKQAGGTWNNFCNFPSRLPTPPVAAPQPPQSTSTPQAFTPPPTCSASQYFNGTSCVTNPCPLGQYPGQGGICSSGSQVMPVPSGSCTSGGWNPATNSCIALPTNSGDCSKIPGSNWNNATSTCSFTPPQMSNMPLPSTQMTACPMGQYWNGTTCQMMQYPMSPSTGGSCNWSPALTQSGCTGSGGTWNSSANSCSWSTALNGTTCAQAGGTWTASTSYNSLDLKLNFLASTLTKLAGVIANLMGKK